MIGLSKPKHPCKMITQIAGQSAINISDNIRCQLQPSNPELMDPDGGTNALDRQILIKEILELYQQLCR